VEPSRQGHTPSFYYGLHLMRNQNRIEDDKRPSHWTYILHMGPRRILAGIPSCSIFQQVELTSVSGTQKQTGRSISRRTFGSPAKNKFAGRHALQGIVQPGLGQELSTPLFVCPVAAVIVIVDIDGIQDAVRFKVGSRSRQLVPAIHVDRSRVTVVRGWSEPPNLQVFLVLRC